MSMLRVLRVVLSLLLSASLLLISTSTASAVVSVNSGRAVVIEGEITGSSMRPVQLHLLKLLGKQDAPEEVQLIIDSPGGSVGAGFEFISAMHALQARGTKFTCFVSGMAASMAFQILVHCDQRIVLQESLLLWHRARVFLGGLFGGAMTAPQLLSLGNQLEVLDSFIYDDVLGALGQDLTPEEVRRHLEAETMHVGKYLARQAPHFVSAERSVSGLFEAISNKKLPRTAPPQFNPFGFDSTPYVPGEIIYIHPTNSGVSQK